MAWESGRSGTRRSYRNPIVSELSSTLARHSRFARQQPHLPNEELHAHYPIGQYGSMVNMDQLVRRNKTFDFAGCLELASGQTLDTSPRCEYAGLGSD